MTKEDVDEIFRKTEERRGREYLESLDLPVTETVDGIIEEMFDRRKVHDVQYGIIGGVSLNTVLNTADVVFRYAERLKRARIAEKTKDNT